MKLTPDCIARELWMAFLKIPHKKYSNYVSVSIRRGDDVIDKERTRRKLREIVGRSGFRILVEPNIILFDELDTDGEMCCVNTNGTSAPNRVVGKVYARICGYTSQ